MDLDTLTNPAAACEGKVLAVVTATQCSFLPFTALPKEYAGRSVKIVLMPETIAAAEDPYDTATLPF